MSGNLFMPLALSLLLAQAPALDTQPAMDPARAVDLALSHPGAKAVSALEAAQRAAPTRELSTALALRRARLVETLEGARPAFELLTKLRAPPALRGALADERVRLARAAGLERYVATALARRLAAVPLARRGAAVLDLVELGLKTSQRGVLDAVQKALDPVQDAAALSAIAGHRELVAGRRAKCAAAIAEALQRTPPPGLLRLLDRYAQEHSLLQAALAPLGREALRQLFRAAVDAGLYGQADAVWQRLRKDPAAPELQLYLLNARRDSAQALALVEQILRAPGGEKRADLALERARLLSRLGRQEEARRAYDDFTTRFPAHPQAERASFFAAWQHHESGAAADAAAAFQRYVAAHPRSGLASKARWLWAFNLYRSDQLEAARQALAQVAQEAGQGEQGYVARYFLALTEGRLGKLEQAQQALAVLATEAAPATDRAPYYHALVRAALSASTSPRFSAQLARPCGERVAVAGLGTGQPPPGDRQEKSGSDCDVALRGRVTQLLPFTPPALRAGLEAVATARLCDVGASLLRGMAIPADPAGARAYLETQLACGDATRVLRTARGLYRDVLRRPPREEERWIWALAYPSPPSLQAASGTVAPPLVLAVARQESHFIAHAESSAGAMGLMQILPSTGLQLAARAGEAGATPPDLLDPNVNLRLGGLYLDGLSDELEGRLPLVAAAYNAGPSAVLGWVQRYGGYPLDVFVESIPFQETRGYVKKVLSAYTVYAWLAGHPDADAWSRETCLNVNPRHAVEF